ncbi:unnamed protein product [Rotaria sordida]|uniref:Helix-turn-helix domain-containing protein n=1 Tax=Rotaria sordida TaxID=392033 RepID=A0A815ATP2_9BILA|nr:unnamed protein product [Rotaria sordida]CAF1540757.1 unnamed protein product [Rotaria sordida]
MGLVESKETSIGNIKHIDVVSSWEHLTESGTETRLMNLLEDNANLSRQRAATALAPIIILIDGLVHSDPKRSDSPENLADNLILTAIESNEHQVTTYKDNIYKTLSKATTLATKAVQIELIAAAASGGLYFRYIDDIFLTINWPARHLFKQINRWNKFDKNIKLSENIGSTADFLDLHIENQDSQLFTTIYQKPSYEPYYLPFNSVHPLHMKKNIIFTMFLRTIRYCSTFQAHLNEREKLRMALLLSKYPNGIIDKQFDHVLSKFNIDQPLDFNNYNLIRQKIIETPIKERIPMDYGKTMFVHFTYCSNMRTFPVKFHILWNKYFGESPINEVLPVLGTRNVKNLQRQLTNTR